MAASLGELLSEEGFRRRKKAIKTDQEQITEEVSLGLPIYICQDKKSIDFSKQRSWKLEQTRGSVLSSGRGSKCDLRSKEEPQLDEVAVKAVVSILNGYIGRFLKDKSFRNSIRLRCSSCLGMKNWKQAEQGDNSEKAILVNMDLGMESIERLAENRGESKELRMISLKNSIRLLSVVACLNSQESKQGFTCGVPNSYLSACAQLYLSIVYKLEKNDRISAKHLLQVFCDSPFQARNNLLPDLWEHFFLPHLLHLKVWYNEEAERISDIAERARKMNALSKVYNDQLDLGTSKFAFYYKEWLKVGVKAPSVPSVSVPAKTVYEISRKNSSTVSSSRDSFSFSLQTSINKDLYRAVFGPSCGPHREEKQDSFLWQDGNEGFFSSSASVVASEGWAPEIDRCKHGNNSNSCIRQSSARHLARAASSGHSDLVSHRRSSSHKYENPRTESISEASKSDYLRFLPCRGDPSGSFVQFSHVPKNKVIAKGPDFHLPSSNLSKNIAVICTSDKLGDVEIAVRMVAKAWLDSHGDSTVELALSNAFVIEGMLEVLFASDDDEILELAISILAELAVRNEMNRRIILNADPQLEIFMSLLGNNNIFLKAAVLLYLLKPKAKQLLSLNWVPLALRILEFADRLQTLFTVQCRPQAAGFYILDQLLTGFDVDKNVENAKQVVSLGGLRLLIRRLEIGDCGERKEAALLLCSCIRADGSCRHFLANNIKKTSIIELLINQSKSGGCALSLLTELICLNRRTQITKFLSGLKNEGRLNTMHILLVYLQRAPLEHCPLVAVVLLQLDLLGDPLQYSMYREEVIDAIIVALDCSSHDKEVQEQCGRALLLLGGHFSYLGEASTEAWLLKKAGLNDGFADSSRNKDNDDEEKATEDWLRKAATVLLVNGNKRFLAALSKSLSNGILCLAKACLVTVAWMSCMFASLKNAEILSMACLILAPRLVECLSYDRTVEERVLASLSLLSFARNSECLFLLSPLENEMVGSLRSLGPMTWTASELLSLLPRV